MYRHATGRRERCALREDSEELGWKATFRNQELPEHDGVRVIDRKATHGSATCRRVAHEPRAIPVKMIAPPIVSRVKKRNSRRRVRINAGKVRSLVSVAAKATEAQVVERFEAAMLPGDHVVDWKREERILVLVNPAVFTPTTSSLPDLLPEPRID